MTEWIRKLLCILQRAASHVEKFFVSVEWRTLPHPEDGPYTVRQMSTEGMLMRVVAHPETCGCRDYMVELQVREEDIDDWYTVAMIDSDHLVATLSLLADAYRFINEVPAEEALPYWLCNGLK